MPTVAVKPLAIIGVGVVSPAGIGVAPLAKALRSRHIDHDARAGVDLAEFPSEPVRVVPELRVADHLGRKGTRYLDRTTALGLLACKQALGGVAGSSDADPAATGVVMGTSTGSIRSSAEFCRDTLVQDRPYLVNPGLFPNTVMNCCAGQIAIWNVLRGVNATLAGGQLSSLFALRYARNAISQGRATRLLVGGVEELSAHAAWGWQQTKALTPGAAVGEGCAVFVVQDGAGEHTPLAELLACEVAYHGGADQRGRLATGLASAVERALERSGVAPEEVGSVSLGATNQVGLERVEERGVRQALGRLPRHQVRVKEVLGECFSASGALQLAALLAEWQREPATRRGAALVTSVGHDGNVGCLVVRVASR